MNFCPPTAAATIAPLLGSVNTATPCSYLAFAATPDATTEAFAAALILYSDALKDSSAAFVSKKMTSENLSAAGLRPDTDFGHGYLAYDFAFMVDQPVAVLAPDD